MAELENELAREVINRFPSVPIDLKAGDNLAEKMEEALGLLAADGGTPAILMERGRSKLSFEDRVLQYFKLQKGKIDVYACAKCLKVSPHRVIEALYELADEGRLSFN
jgi:hypothetical protein